MNIRTRENNLLLGYISESRPLVAVEPNAGLFFSFQIEFQQFLPRVSIFITVYMYFHFCNR